jgi:acyl-CoA thioester hydrolase
MKEHEFNVRVRYAETDQMGLFIMGYAQYFEMGRVEWLRNLGFLTNGWKKRYYASSGFLEYKLKKPARYDDLLRVNYF